MERHFAVFRDEFATLRREDFLLWHDHAAYGGQWLVAPLFMSSHFQGIEAQCAANPVRCTCCARTCRSRRRPAR